MNNFSELGLSPNTLKALDELGFKSPTPVQAQAIPQLLESKRDLIGLAQTGTGKTAAFSLPLLEYIDPQDKVTQALILSPTRELGQQIAEQIKLFSKYHPRVNSLAVYGGSSIEKQIKDLRRTTHIIIATPGRLIDLMKRGKISLENVHTVVLDEADEMLSMGFQDDLNAILDQTPEDKNTWLFSATMPAEIESMVHQYMTDPVEVKINTKNVVNKNIEHLFVQVRVADKEETLKRFIDIHPRMRGIVFCRTRRDTQELAESLIKQGYMADALHGDLSQSQRNRVMRRFKAYSINVLIATDVAARGIDVDDLTHVVHYSLPDDPSYYTHRSGRTARAGKKGISLVLVTKSNVRRKDEIERKLKIKMELTKIPDVEDILSSRTRSWAQSILEADLGDKIDSTTLDIAEETFGDLSKSQLIERLVALEHKKLKYNASNRDLNAEFGGKGDDRNKKSSKPKKLQRREEKHEARKNKGAKQEKRKEEGKKRPARDHGVRYFINLGKYDGLSRNELKDFICHFSGIKEGDIGNVSMLKKYSYFDVPPSTSSKLDKSFKNLTINGHKIRVNRD